MSDKKNEVKKNRKAPKITPKRVESAAMFENTTQDIVFAFAEKMKQRYREEDSMVENERLANEVKLTRRPTTRTKGGVSLQFSDADLEEFRKRLIMLRQEELERLTTLRTVALEQTDERGREDEDSSDSFMRLQNLKQVDSQSRIVQQIDDALARIKEGNYGICEVCGQLIRKPRLLNLPFVRTCIECQTAMENKKEKN